MSKSLAIKQHNKLKQLNKELTKESENYIKAMEKLIEEVKKLDEAQTLRLEIIEKLTKLNE